MPGIADTIFQTQSGGLARTYSTQSTPHGYGLDKKRQVLQLSKEGLGFQSIGRIVAVSNVTVWPWIRGMGQAVQQFVATHPPVRTAEGDGQRGHRCTVALRRRTQRKCWGWLAVARATDPVLADRLGSRGRPPATRLWAA